MKKRNQRDDAVSQTRRSNNNQKIRVFCRHRLLLQSPTLLVGRCSIVVVLVLSLCRLLMDFRPPLLLTMIPFVLKAGWRFFCVSELRRFTWPTRKWHQFNSKRLFRQRRNRNQQRDGRRIRWAAAEEVSCHRPTLLIFRVCRPCHRRFKGVATKILTCRTSKFGQRRTLLFCRPSILAADADVAGHLSRRRVDEAECNPRTWKMRLLLPTQPMRFSF